MYRLLIVDDERIARESVQSLLAAQNDMELEILSAESAMKAISILESERIDIAVLDINMPQMTGLELYETVRKNWPQCKVVFLTGYSEFDYVYKVHKHAKYVLKADREEVLVEAVRESIQEIEKEMLIARASDSDPEHKKRAGRYRSDGFMNELMDGYTDLSVLSNEVLRDMNIDLEFRKPVYSVLLRCDGIAESDFERRQLASEQVYLLLEKYFGKRAGCLIVSYRKYYFFLLLQPWENLPEQSAIRRLSGICSLLQSALQANGDLSAAILIPDQPMSFREAMSSFRLFFNALGSVELGDTQVFPVEQSKSTGDREEVLSDQAKARLLQTASMLEYAFDSGNREEALSLLGSVRKDVSGVKDMQDLFLMELYMTISKQLISALRGYDLTEIPGLRDEITQLFHMVNYHSWGNAFARLEGIAEKVFDLREKTRTEQEEDLVSQIKRFVQRHIDSDTSVTAIADRLHFSREYLTRVFKKEEGVTILQYVNDQKIKRAKELLKNPDLTVKEISAMTGFGGTGQFIRFFKSKTGQSPQAYRDGK